MELSELQQRVDAWIRQYGVRYFSELTNMAVLTEEVGELARIMARKYGDQSFKEGEKCDLADEMADVLWGTGMPCEPDGCRPHGGSGGEFRQENLARQRAAPAQSEALTPKTACPRSHSKTTAAPRHKTPRARPRAPYGVSAYGKSVNRPLSAVRWLASVWGGDPE